MADRQSRLPQQLVRFLGGLGLDPLDCVAANVVNVAKQAASEPPRLLAAKMNPNLAWTGRTALKGASRRLLRLLGRLFETLCGSCVGDTCLSDVLWV